MYCCNLTERGFKGDKQMRRFSKTILVSAVIAALAGLAVTGCGQARPENGTTEKTSEPSGISTAVTEAVVIIQTEAPVIIETEPETQPQTQPVTEVQTEPQTQPETTPPTEAVLSADEELAQSNEYTDWISMFANADVNVRETPTADNQDNIISSYDRGEEAVIIGETVNWYKIYKEHDPVSEADELVGYVMKKFISPTYEEAMSDKPQETAAPAEQPAQPAEPQTVTPETAAPAATPETTAPAASSASGPSVTLNTDANIRSEAYETASVVGVVTKGSTATQIGSSDGWVQIEYNGVQGYVKASFVG